MNLDLLSNLRCRTFIFRLGGSIWLAKEVLLREGARITEGSLLHRRDRDVLPAHIGERHHVLTSVLQGENQIQPSWSSTTRS